MFAPNLRRKIFGWLVRLKNSAGTRLSHKNIRRRCGTCLKKLVRRLAAAAEGSIQGQGHRGLKFAKMA